MSIDTKLDAGADRAGASGLGKKCPQNVLTCGLRTRQTTSHQGEKTSVRICSVYPQGVVGEVK